MKTYCGTYFNDRENLIYLTSGSCVEFGDYALRYDCRVGYSPHMDR